MSLHQTREVYESVRSVRVGWRCHLYTLRLTDLEWIIKPGPLLALLLHPADAKSVKYSDHSRCASCQSGLLIYLFSHLFILFHFYFYFFKSPIAQIDAEISFQGKTLLQDEGLVVCGERVGRKKCLHMTGVSHLIAQLKRCLSSSVFLYKSIPFRRRLQCWTLRIKIFFKNRRPLYI